MITKWEEVIFGWDLTTDTLILNWTAIDAMIAGSVLRSGVQAFLPHLTFCYKYLLFIVSWPAYKLTFGLYQQDFSSLKCVDIEKNIGSFKYFIEISAEFLTSKPFIWSILIPGELINHLVGIGKPREHLEHGTERFNACRKLQIIVFKKSSTTEDVDSWSILDQCDLLKPIKIG